MTHHLSKQIFRVMVFPEAASERRMQTLFSMAALRFAAQARATVPAGADAIPAMTEFIQQPRALRLT